MSYCTRNDYEPDREAWPADAYTVAGWGEDIAWYVHGWETAPDEDTEWTGIEPRTGRVVATMVGDDARFAVDPEDLTPLGELDYCAECGQVGCCHDGRDRSEVGQ
jgi:hypothetical protein